MSENDAIGGVRRKPNLGGMENPTASLTSDAAIPDRQPKLTGVAMDTPEARMAIRNEARSRVVKRDRDVGLINDKLELIT